MERYLKQEFKVYREGIIMVGIIKLNEIRNHWETTNHRIVGQFDQVYYWMDLKKSIEYQLQEEEPQLILWPQSGSYLNQLEQNSKRVYCPLSNLSIDESFINFKGGRELKQYRPTNIIKDGLNAFCCVKQILGTIRNNTTGLAGVHNEAVWKEYQ